MTASRSPLRATLVGFGALLLLLATLPAPASANPAVPYCLGSVSPAPKQAPAVLMPEICEAATGRVFPEAMARPEYAAAGNTGYASDFVSFFEFEAGIKYLEAQFPDLVTVLQVGESYGLQSTPQASRDRFPIYTVEVTNEKSPVPADQKLELLFMLSIHGNEKGGREGGMRVLEDLVTGKGIALEKVQNGAGLSNLTKPTGGAVETYADYLDFMRLHFLFPNADGWVHDELPYAATQAGLCLTLFCRTNGNGTDLNRQTPTIGWQQINADSGRLAVNEPEAKGYLEWMVNGHNWNYAIDIHGMLMHENFVAIMLPAGSFSPQEMQRSTRLAESLKERLNGDGHFGAWTSLFGTAQDVGDTAMGALAGSPACTTPPPDPLPKPGCPASSPTVLIGSGEFSDWSTVWDAIGYTDSGFSGDFFAQSTGLNAPGYDIELAYNHITVDSQYEAGGALFNDFHVHAVRHIVKSFMDAAALDVQISYETEGKKTLYVASQYVATNLDDKSLTPGGWADANPDDDHWQYSGETPFRARPAKYWEDIAPFVKNRDVPGVLQPTTADKLTPELLSQYDTLVIAGSAINQFVSGTAGSNKVAEGAPDQPRLQAILDWVKGGGNLVLTDGGLKFFDLAGLTSGAVKPDVGYAGAVNMDREHPLTKNVRGEARQTYEPVPLGFQVGFNSPIWSIDADAFKALNGDVAGTGYRNDGVSLGRLTLGSGQIQFLGALLPDPTEEFYHPYGLDDYATTYSGNQILRNMLGWSEVFAAPPVVITGAGEVQQSPNEPAAGMPLDSGGAAEAADGKGTPTIEPVLLLAALLGLLAVRRRTP